MRRPGGWAAGDAKTGRSFAVSDEKQGAGDKRKPKATFGDVMKGIPSGRREERREGGDSDQRPPGDAESASEAARSAKPPERRHRGPMVVVKRAGPPVAATPASPARPAPESGGPESGGPAVETAPAAAPAPVVPVRAPDETLYRDVAEHQSFAEM